MRENGSLFPDENRGSERKVSLVRTVTGRTRIRPQVQQVPELKLLKEQNGRVQQNGIVLPKILRPSHQGCKRCSEVVGENSKDKAAVGSSLAQRQSSVVSCRCPPRPERPLALRPGLGHRVPTRSAWHQRGKSYSPGRHQTAQGAGAVFGDQVKNYSITPSGAGLFFFFFFFIASIKIFKT